VENSRGARKLARTPHVNQKKKKLVIEEFMVRVINSKPIKDLFNF